MKDVLRARRERTRLLPQMLVHLLCNAAAAANASVERARINRYGNHMTGRPVDLDGHRDMAARKETILRRLRTEIAGNETQLRCRQRQLAAHMIAAPAANRLEAAEKARYVIDQYAASMCGQDPRIQTLIATVFADFDRLSR